MKASEKEFLGKRLKKVRERRGMTQGQLADRCETNQARISALESRNSKSTELLFDLADVLEVNPRWLLTGEGDPDQIASSPAETMLHRYKKASPTAKQVIDILLSDNSLRDNTEAKAPIKARTE